MAGQFDDAEAALEVLRKVAPDHGAVAYISRELENRRKNSKGHKSQRSHSVNRPKRRPKAKN
jgi:hypothetical protein